MVLINHKDVVMPGRCAECYLCDNYCLILRRPFIGFNPNEERDPKCPLIDVFVDEDQVLHAVR